MVICPLTEVRVTVAFPVPTVPVRWVWPETKPLKPDTSMDPFAAVACILKDDAEGRVNARFAFVADKE
jgi:hypothetical protein